MNLFLVRVHLATVVCVFAFLIVGDTRWIDRSLGRSGQTTYRN